MAKLIGVREFEYGVGDLIIISSKMTNNKSWFLSQLDSDFGIFLNDSQFVISKTIPNSRLEEVHLEKGNIKYRILHDVLGQDFSIYKYKNGAEVSRKNFDGNIQSIQKYLSDEIKFPNNILSFVNWKTTGMAALLILYIIYRTLFIAENR